MTLINDLLKGAVALSMIALIQNGCSVRQMAERAASVHERGLTSYGAYSRVLVGDIEK